MTADVIFTVLYHVVLPKGVPPGWDKGPLPVLVLLREEDATKKDSPLVSADSVWRSKHLLPRVAEVLTGQHPGTARLHRRFPEGHDVSANKDVQVRLDALEMLLVRKPSPGPVSDPRRRIGVLAAHLRVVEPPWVVDSDASSSAHQPTTLRIIGGIKHLCRGLAEATGEDLRWVLPPQLMPAIGPSVEPAEGYDNAYVAALLTTRAPQKSKPPPIPDIPELWNLAMVSPSRRPGPPVDQDAGLALTLPKTEVLVTRLGLVQRASGQGDPTVPNTTNGQHCYRFQTIYLDGLLLAMMQQRMLGDLADASARLVDPVRSPVGFNRLSREFRRFRVTWWWRNFSRWMPADRVMKAAQEMLGLDSHYHELREDHEFFADMLRAANTSRLNALILALAILGTAGVAAELIVMFEISDRLTQTVIVASVPSVAIVVWLAVAVGRRIAAWLRQI